VEFWKFLLCETVEDYELVHWRKYVVCGALSQAVEKAEIYVY
jgi:hypothetical protein